MYFDFNHLKNVKSNYFKHFYYAMYFNLLALLVFITGIIHAIFPFVFAFTPYKLAKKITDGTEKTFKSK
jgi:ABC-type long-subunit fatty acid transport system fused permease/ATPase subunit